MREFGPGHDRVSAAAPPEPVAAPPHHRITLAVGIAMIVLGLMSGGLAFMMVRAHTFNPVVAVGSTLVPAPEAVFSKNRIYLLLLGLDYDYDTNDMPTSKNARTDKIEAFGIDFPSKVIKSVAVPRDLDAIVNGHEDKINDAYHYGGATNTGKVVGEVLGLSKNDRGQYFDRYVALRINASKDVINAIGGIDVPVTETLNYDDSWGHLHIHFKPGLVHMNGEEAVSYARFRHDACGDPCRIKRQQQVERLAVEKLKKDKINDLAHLADLIGVVRRDVDTNLTFDEMRSLAWAFRDFNIADLHATQIPFTGDKELACCGDVLVIDEPGRNKVAADFVGPYLAVVPTPSNEALAAVKPTELHVEVRNGSGVAGLGAKVAERLRKDGYVVGAVGNADSFDYEQTQIRTSTTMPYAGERVRRDLRVSGAAIAPVAPPSAVPGAASAATPHPDVTIVVGRDYAATLQTASPPAP